MIDKDRWDEEDREWVEAHEHAVAYETYDALEATMDSLQTKKRAARQAVDALVEAHFLYEFPINVIFNGRADLIQELNESIEEMQINLGRDFWTHNLTRRDHLYKMLTGESVLEKIKESDE